MPLYKVSSQLCHELADLHYSSDLNLRTNTRFSFLPDLIFPQNDQIIKLRSVCN